MASLLSVIPIVSDVLDRLIPDLNADKKAEAEQALNLLKASMASQQAQLEVNKAEAGHSSIFVAGWRPFIGWICGLALAYNYLVRPIAIWIICIYFPEAPLPIGLDDVLWELLFGILGISGLRSYEKIKKVAR